MIPVTPEQQPVVGAEQTFQTVRQVQARLNPALADPLFLLTQVDARRSDHTAYRAMLLEHYGPLMMASAIRTSASLSRKYAAGQTAFDAEPTGRGPRDYANAADELLTIARAGGRHTSVRGRAAALHGTLTPPAVAEPPASESPSTDAAPSVEALDMPAFTPVADLPLEPEATGATPEMNRG